MFGGAGVTYDNKAFVGQDLDFGEGSQKKEKKEMNQLFNKIQIKK